MNMQLMANARLHSLLSTLTLRLLKEGQLEQNESYSTFRHTSIMPLVIIQIQFSAWGPQTAIAPNQ
jgi:hypothetical protein